MVKYHPKLKKRYPKRNNAFYTKVQIINKLLVTF